ncbi:MAG: DUF1549 and DUF1553 domain-containing protein [Planctomycetota bacterium]
MTLASQKLLWTIRATIGLCILVAGSGLSQGQSLEVFPRTVHLDGPRDFQRLIVRHVDKFGLSVDVTDQASFQVLAPSVANLDGNVVRPTCETIVSSDRKSEATEESDETDDVVLEDAVTRVVVKYGNDLVEVPVHRGSPTQDPSPVSFDREIVPVLTKTGCNSGRCHGASRGKDGFQLSLFGYDAEGDHYRIKSEMIGRRINLAVPEQSLLLRKAIGEVAHTGGKRFDTDSDAYQTLVDWIHQGATLDEFELPDPISLSLYPSQTTLLAGSSEQPLVAVAHYSDGSSRDVTDLCVYSTTNDHVLEVSEAGRMTAKSHGETSVMARFATITQRSEFIVLDAGERESQTQVARSENLIDQAINEKLRKLRIQPSDLCTDEEFLRRVFIDLLGLTPTAEDYRKFMGAPVQSRRNDLIDELLKREEFIDLWTMKWGELLRVRTANQVSYKALLGFHDWLRERIANNTPWNEIARDVLGSSGGTFENPPTNYYQIEPNPQLIAENVAQVFLGMRIQCAKCHNHPFDRWTMDDYYGFADFFGQVGFKQSRDPREFIVYNRGRGEIEHFIKSRSVQPKFLGGDTPEIDGIDRRKVLAEWIASDENPFFSTRMANVVWQHHFGRGIVEPVDDVRISNPPSNTRLLSQLGKAFADHSYDVRWLVREICQSDAYQRSTRANETNENDEVYHSRSVVRRIRAEVLLDSISQITGSYDRFPRLPIQSRAVEIADGAISNYFLSTFGRASRETVCSCEVDATPTLSQAFHLLNGEITNAKIRQGGRIAGWLDRGWSPERIIEELYLDCFSRKIRPAEMQRLLATLNGEQLQADLEDIFWALLNSKEFVFNH